MVAISLFRIGGYSLLRSKMSLWTSGSSEAPPRGSTRSVSNKLRIPSFSKPEILRRSVLSGVPVWRDLSATEPPKITGWRMRPYSSCSGNFRSSLSCPQSSVGSTLAWLAMRHSSPATPCLLPPVPQADVALLPLDGSKPFSTSRSHSMPRYGMEVNFLQRRYRYM